MVLGICQNPKMNLLLLCVSRAYCALKMGRIKSKWRESYSEAVLPIVPLGNAIYFNSPTYTHTTHTHTHTHTLPWAAASRLLQ